MRDIPLANPLLQRATAFWRANIPTRRPACLFCKGEFAEDARVGAYLARGSIGRADNGLGVGDCAAAAGFVFPMRRSRGRRIEDREIGAAGSDVSTGGAAAMRHERFLEGRGRRTPSTLLMIDERDALLVEAARFYE